MIFSDIDRLIVDGQGCAALPDDQSPAVAVDGDVPDRLSFMAEIEPPGDLGAVRMAED